MSVTNFQSEVLLCHELVRFVTNAKLSDFSSKKQYIISVAQVEKKGVDQVDR